MSVLFMEVYLILHRNQKMFCRLCAQEEPHTIPIFSETSLNIDNILYNLLAIEVSREDVLPTVICLDCFRKTNTLNEFKASAQRAQEILKLLNTSKPEIELTSVVEVDDTKQLIIESNSDIEGAIEMCEDEDTAEIEVLVEVEDEQPESELNSSNEKLTRLRRDEFKNLLCTDCNEIFRSPVLLTKHFKTKHDKLVQFKCSYCSQIYQKYRSFTRHVVTHLQTNRYICEVCDRSFSQKCGLKNHLFSHMQDRTFECPECHLKFKQLSSLFNHRKMHTHVYSCDECKKVFSTSITLLQHKKAKHFNQKDKICDICNKAYASLPGLYYHKLSHLQQTHTCSICDRKFNTNSLLKRHMNVHKDSGAEHTCEFCGKSFKSKNSLILHKKTHNGVYDEDDID